MIYVIIPIFVLIIFYFFSSKVSPIPYFPTNSADLDKIIKAFEMRNNMTIIDLGAGDGAVIFAAAKKAYELGLNTRFVAVDINVILTTIMQIRRLFHPNKSNIKIICKDMFKLDFRSILNNTTSCVLYIYISPWFTKAVDKLIKDQNIKAKIVSYFYPVEDKKESQKIKGIHDIYIYTP